MRKLQSDINEATKFYNRSKETYERAMGRLVSLKEMEEAVRLDEAGKLKVNLRNTVQYGTYLNGVQAAFCWLDSVYLSGGKALSRDDVMRLKANIRLALKSKLWADRIIGGWNDIRYEPIKDKKGNVTGYEAKPYVKIPHIVEL